jgi:hypothetical protein
VRVISWNMGMASPRRRTPGSHDQAWHYLLGLGPDLAFVQEALPPAWVNSHGAVVHGPITRWGSALFSPRYPLAPLRLPVESPLRRLGTYLAFAVASLPDGSEPLVASVHAVARRATKTLLSGVEPDDISRASLDGPRVNDLVFTELAKEAGVEHSFLVAGDWNTGRMQRNRRAGEEFFARAEGSRWYDCVWQLLGHEVQTWFGKGGLFQDDHAFCDKGLGRKLRGVMVATEAAT